MHQRNISVVGLGYVGLPVAVAFGKLGHVVGYDYNANRIEELNRGDDHTLEVTTDDLRVSDVSYTNDPAMLGQADFHIVAVPTPINEARQPDLLPLLGASEAVGKQLKKGDIVVYESTVYPGATEEDCIPVLEQFSGLKSGVDFFVGYSPERINPGDRDHSFQNITKIVSGQTDEILDIVANVYSSVVSAGVYRASSIKVAEAAKVIENTQRDLNIALMNELAIIFEKMDIDTLEVLKAAGTKWNFLPFRPGLVGGHCIGVDPYYLTHKAEKLGYHPDVILAGRRINDGVSTHITQHVIKNMVKNGVEISHSRIGILGLTFKENCPDLRNSKVIDLIHAFEDWGSEILVHDPVADPAEAKSIYGVNLVDWDELIDLDALVVSVSHNAYRDLDPVVVSGWMRSPAAIFDVKAILDKERYGAVGRRVDRL